MVCDQDEHGGEHAAATEEGATGAQLSGSLSLASAAAAAQEARLAVEEGEEQWRDPSTVVLGPAMERAAGEEEAGEPQEGTAPAGGLIYEIPQWLPEWSDSGAEDMSAEPSGRPHTTAAVAMERAAVEEEAAEPQENAAPAGGVIHEYLIHEYYQWWPIPERSDSVAEDVPAEPNGQPHTTAAVAPALQSPQRLTAPLEEPDAIASNVFDAAEGTNQPVPAPATLQSNLQPQVCAKSG